MPVRHNLLTEPGGDNNPQPKLNFFFGKNRKKKVKNVLLYISK